jgi:peptidylprolyl isomerase
MRASRLSAIAVACVLVIAACGDSDDSTAGDTTAGDTTTTLSDGSTTTGPADDASAASSSTVAAEDAPNGGKPEVAAGEGEPPTELEIEDIVTGTGAEATAGSAVEVHYVGALFDDGEQFDSSWDRDSTFEFVLGRGEVIPGWDEGLAGMKVGGRRRIVIPPDLAYGSEGAGDVIGPDATLIFVVDLIGVSEPVDPADEPAVEVPDPLPQELYTEDLRVGDGAEATAGTTASIHYVGVAASTGEQFDSSWQRGIPVDFAVGLGQVIPGFDQGVTGMKVGGRRLIVIPPDLAYGSGGNGPIGPDETLVFVVDLVDVE